MEWDYNILKKHLSNWTMSESSETQHEAKTKTSDRPVKQMTAEETYSVPLSLLEGNEWKVVSVNMKRRSTNECRRSHKQRASAERRGGDAEMTLRVGVPRIGLGVSTRAEGVKKLGTVLEVATVAGAGCVGERKIWPVSP